MNRTPRYIASEIFRSSRHAPGHPLAIPRVSLATDLCRTLDWLPQSAYVEATAASDVDLHHFHDPAYVAAVCAAERTGRVTDDVKRRFNLGVNGNALYPEIFRRPATACGASLLAAARLAAGPAVIHCPAGGNHHARSSRASGFCIFNDIVLAIAHFLDNGVARVFYLDLDAHFADAVQDAFHDHDRVFTMSIHEAGRWPMRTEDTWTARPGGAFDRAGGAARNLPVPAGCGDSETYSWWRRPSCRSSPTSIRMRWSSSAVPTPSTTIR